MEPSLEDRPTGDLQAAGLTIAVVVATTGRPRTSRLTIDRLARQSRPPDRVLAVGVTPADLAELGDAAIPVESYFAPRGLCSQRNRGLAILGGDCDLVVFFDDDYLAADSFLENAEWLFLQYPDIVGATGRVLADGANGRGIGFEEAEAILAAESQVTDRDRVTRPKRGLYGCNMVFRTAAIGDQKFDENLPLYGWQEDVDFSYRLRNRGRRVQCDALRGVHMGEKIGRTSGRRLGYSQIANPLYLLGKGSIPRDLAWRIMRNNVSSNIWGSIRPEPYIDRRGRLAGNLLAIRDLAARRLDPRRILEMS
jgi:GT2 family glycosyltransferase